MGFRRVEWVQWSGRSGEDDARGRANRSPVDGLVFWDAESNRLSTNVGQWRRGLRRWKESHLEDGSVDLKGIGI